MTHTPKIQYSKRVNEQTPAGGAYHIAYFFNSKGNPVSEEDAEECIIQEFDENDNMIAETITNPIIFESKI